MSEHILKTLEQVKSDITGLELQLAEKKRMANYLSEMAGAGPVYADADEPSSISATSHGDEFYGKTATAAAREVLEKRKRMGLGPATLAEIYESLTDGGYQFDASSTTNAKNSLRVTLSKRSETFHKLPNGKIGLTKWYTNIKPTKKRKGFFDEPEDDGREAMEAEFGSSSPDELVEM